MIGRDRRQVLVIIVVMMFMAVTVGHVASYTGSFEPDGWQWLGILYALAVDASIGVCAWLTRWKTTCWIALIAYIVFTLADGVFNVAHIQPWTTAVPLAAWVYALFPTAAQALLGLVARNTDLLAERSANARRGRKATASPIAKAVQPAPALPVPAFTARQLAQIERVVAVYGANENATLRDLQGCELIGSETTASRARQRAITGGYLRKTVQGFAPNGKGPQEVA